jgi:hypothetical protein
MREIGGLNLPVGPWTELGGLAGPWAHGPPSIPKKKKKSKKKNEK